MREEKKERLGKALSMGYLRECLRRWSQDEPLHGQAHVEVLRQRSAENEGQDEEGQEWQERITVK